MLIPVTTTKIRTLRMTNPYSTVDLERCRVVVVPGWYGGGTGVVRWLVCAGGWCARWWKGWCVPGGGARCGG